MAVTDALFLTPAQVADHAGLSVKSVYRAIRRGELAASKLGAVIRIRARDFDAWVDSSRVAPLSADCSMGETAPDAPLGVGTLDALRKIKRENS